MCLGMLPVFKHATVDGEGLLHRTSQGEVALVPAAAACAHPLAKLGVEQKLFDTRSEPLAVSALDNEPALAVVHGFRYSSDGRRDHRETCSHGLEDAARESFPVADQEKRLGLGESGLDIQDLSEETNPIAKSKGLAERGNLRLEGSVANEIELPRILAQSA